MKKITILALPLLILSACGGKTKNVDISSLHIACPTGAPAYAFYKEAGNPNFETNSVPKNIIAMMTSASDKQFVVIDTTSGVQAINNGAPYKLAASLTFGNFFIASTGKDDNDTMDAGDKIVIFNEKGTPDLLFHYLYGNAYDSGIEYVTNVQDAAACLIKGKNDVTGNDIKYVFIAQPVLTNALAKNTNAKKYVDIQKAYKEKSNGKSLIQASLFVKNESDKDVNDAFLKNLKDNINEAILEPTVITEALKNLAPEEATSKFGVAPSLAVSVLKDENGLGLGFEYGLDNKPNIDAFLKDVMNIKETDEAIYYK